MPEFLKLQPPFQALKNFLEHLPEKPIAIETVQTVDAIRRVLAEDILAPHPLPEFPRSTMDGYAVQSANTYGASDSQPAFLKLVGEIPMGKDPQIALHKGESALIHTGGMIPDGADAVVILEQSQFISPDLVQVYKSVSPNENVIQAGEDVQTGDLVIPAGKTLRIPEIGGLMSFGITRVKVARKPLVGILSSGDEVIPVDQQPLYGQVRDINAATMSALVQESGGEVRSYGIVPDDRKKLEERAHIAFNECDVVIITAGSSASGRDMTADIIQELGKPGVLTHGVNVRPGKPTILAVCDGKPVIGLPGNPISALVVARIFVKPVIERLLGKDDKGFHPTIQVKIAANFSSAAGREDWIPVSLRKEGDGWLAVPIFFKSNLIFNLVQADALVHIPADLTGLQAGDMAAAELI
jgi:molybdopterin molybdotransferase